MKKLDIENEMAKFYCRSLWWSGWDYDFVQPDDIVAALKKKVAYLNDLSPRRLTLAEKALIKMSKTSPLFVKG